MTSSLRVFNVRVVVLYICSTVRRPFGWKIFRFQNWKMNLGWKKWGFFSVISEHTWDRRQKRRHAKRAKKSISHPTSAYFPFFSWSIFGNTHSPLSGAILLPTLDDFYDSSFTFFNFSAPQAKISNIFSSQNRIFLLFSPFNKEQPEQMSQAASLFKNTMKRLEGIEIHKLASIFHWLTPQFMRESKICFEVRRLKTMLDALILIATQIC